MCQHIIGCMCKKALDRECTTIKVSIYLSFPTNTISKNLIFLFFIFFSSPQSSHIFSFLTSQTYFYLQSKSFYFAHHYWRQPRVVKMCHTINPKTHSKCMHAGFVKFLNLIYNNSSFIVCTL
jgi:hypothetical protein